VLPTPSPLPRLSEGTLMACLLRLLREEVYERIEMKLRQLAVVSPRPMHRAHDQEIASGGLGAGISPISTFFSWSLMVSACASTAASISVKTAGFSARNTSRS